MLAATCLLSADLQVEPPPPATYLWLLQPVLAVRPAKCISLLGPLPTAAARWCSSQVTHLPVLGMSPFVLAVCPAARPCLGQCGLPAPMQLVCPAECTSRRALLLPAQPGQSRLVPRLALTMRLDRSPLPPATPLAPLPAAQFVSPPGPRLLARAVPWTCALAVVARVAMLV